MTRGVNETPPEPGTATAGRASDRARPFTRRVRIAPAGPAIACLVALVLAQTLTTSVARAARKGDGLPDGVVSAVVIEGNVSVSSEKVRAKLLSKPGAPLDARQIAADVQSLMGTKWFTEVTPYFDKDPKDPSGRSYLLIFTVKEMPVLTRVEFRGLTKIKLKEIEELTGLKKGSRADATRTQLAVGQIKRLYDEKGFELAEVTLVKGGSLGDTQVVIRIAEGPKHYVGAIDFEGNVFATDAILRTKVVSKVRLLRFIGGKYHRDNLEEDARKLKDYYHSQGFFEVAVTPVTRTGSDLGEQRITYVVSEGTRYKVRNIAFDGNKKIPTAKLRDGLVLHSGQPILETLKEADRKTLLGKYNALGCIDTQIQPEPKYTDQPGVVDLVYKIEEGEPYRLGEMIIRGNERTKSKVLLREAAMAGLLPGEPLDANRIEIYRKRLSSLGFFINSPEQGKPLDVKLANKRRYDQLYGDGPRPDLDGASLTRMQGPDAEPPPPVEVPRVEPIVGQGPPVTSAPGGSGPSGFGAGAYFNPPPDTPPIDVPIPNTPPPGGPGGRGVAGRRGAAPTTPPIGAGEPPGTIPSIPGLNATDVGPDRQDPFSNRNGFVDIVSAVEEAPTGRFMFGVGASSYGGLNGNLTVTEKNFDLFNVPRSWNDLVGGNAFRGAGQTFQLELMPGTLINRFQVSLREPYLFDLPIGASGAGYLFNRIYPNWTESRGGGRFSLGRQFGTQTYADVAVRTEEVNFYGYRSPAPADYLAASGHTFLSTIRPSLRFDNRNAPFMPNKGQYLEFSYEQAFGSFFYPKGEVEGRTYFTLGSRPDGSGKRILTFRGHLGATGRDTPVYERFFAGNFGSLRGFQYRGVGPRVLGQNVGGIFEALGAVEYQFPLAANDMFHQVVFCDFGTVENDYKFSNIRASVGTGLRMLIPAFGPLPLSFDLAFPVAQAQGDRVQIFNFTIGAFY